MRNIPRNALRHPFTILAALALLSACSRQPDLSVLKVFQTTVTEPEGSNLTIFAESGGVATPLLQFTVGSERPTLFVQTTLPGRTMQVAVSTSRGGSRSAAVPDLFDAHQHSSHAYGGKRTGSGVVLFETTGSGPTPPNRLYVAPTPNP